MKIGIKFCGGCNPFYERGAAVKKYMKEHPEHNFEFVREDEEYELIVIVCGCMCRCVTYDTLTSKYGFVIVSSEKDFELITEKINEIQKCNS